MTERQKRFIEEYCIDLNAQQAYLRAGYNTSESVAAVEACKMLKKPEIRAEVEKRLAKKAEKAGLTADYVLEGIKSIADSNKARNQDRLKAYELLGKHLKLFTDKVEAENINFNDNLNKNIDFSHLTTEEIRELLNRED